MPTSCTSTSSRGEASATVTLLQALSQFREAFPQLPDEDFQLSVLAILPPHFEKVVEVWDEACEHFKTLDNLMRLVDGIAHALAVSSGDQGEQEGKKGEKQVDSKEFIKKLNDFLASAPAKPVTTKQEPAKEPELVDLTQEEEVVVDVKDVKPKMEGGLDLKQIFSGEIVPAPRIKLPPPVAAPVQLKKARLTLPPPPPSASVVSLQQSSAIAPVTNMLTGRKSTGWEIIKQTPDAKSTGKIKQPVNGLRKVTFEIVKEEFNIARRREYFHDYVTYDRPLVLQFKSGPVEAVGHGKLYLTKYGDIMAHHVPTWRTDGISYRQMQKGLKRPIDPNGFQRLFKAVMEKPEPREIVFELRLNEFCWTERKPASGSATDSK